MNMENLEEKVLWKPGNMLYPLPAVLVSVTDGAGTDNILTIAWAGTVCTNPPMISISVRPSRYSCGMIRKTKEFVVNLTTAEMASAVDYCGVRSGRDVDKFKELGLIKEPADCVSAPLVGQSPVNIECRVEEEIPLGSHILFLARVEAVHVKKKFLDERNRLLLDQAGLMVYSHGEYRSLGKKLGFFGYSVQKIKAKNGKKTAKH